jgi:hypothetical protein
MIRLKQAMWGGIRESALLLVFVAGIGIVPGLAQVNTRLLLSSGTEVPGHGGLAFGPFSNVAMNGHQDIVFLTSLHSPRADLHAIVRSIGVGFGVVAFQGLVGPFPRTTYDSFSAPSIDDSGVVAFSTKLVTDQANVPTSAIVIQDGGKPRAVVTNLDSPPDIPGAMFDEFSAPVLTSDGSVLFGARWSGKAAGSGLFRWSAGGVQSLPLAAGATLGKKDLIEPFFYGHDEAAFARSGVSAEVATDQFFRAIAIQTFQQLQPPPDPANTVEFLATRPNTPPVSLWVVYLENGHFQTALVAGDPTKPVVAKQSLTTTALKPVGTILSLTLGPSGHMIFAASPADAPNDVALYCDCGAQENRLTTSDDFLAINTAGPGKPILSLTGDMQETIAFIGPGSAGDNTAVYVTSIH